MKPKDLNTTEYPEYYQRYIGNLPQENLLNLLRDQKEKMITFLETLEHENLMFSYAEGKWTVAQVIQHMIDTERIFQYRALCIARKDKTPLPGFDQDAYGSFSEAHHRDTATFINEYEAVRDSGITLFESFNPSMLKEIGHSSGGSLSTAAAGFIIAGHENHHIKLFKSNYGL